MKIDRAIVLAGGMGTRLRPYTITIPKPLLPLGEKPIVELVIRKLVASGIRHVTLAINRRTELIKAYLGTGDRFSAKLDYSIEHDALGTIGPLRLIPDLPENFLIMNADVLSDLDFNVFADRHLMSGAAFTIGATWRETPLDYGVLEVEKGSLIGFREKPAVRHCVSMGIYAASRKVLDFVPASGAFGFDQLMLKLLSQQEAVNVHVHKGYWVDVGRPSDYEQAALDFDGTRLPPI